MADPRNAVNNEAFAEPTDYVTFHIDNSTITYDSAQVGGSAQVGLVVTYSADDTVQLIGDGEAVVGKLIKVESDDKCVVQVKGWMTLPAGDGATVTRGSKIVGDLGVASAEGYVRDVNTAVAAELGVQRGMISNVADTAAIVVKL